jgi:hypothetical protein
MPMAHARRTPTSATRAVLDRLAKWWPARESDAR